MRGYNPTRIFLLRSGDHWLSLRQQSRGKTLTFRQPLNLQRYRINGLHKRGESAVYTESPSGQRLVSGKPGRASRTELSAKPPRDESHERGNTSGGRKKEQILPAHAVKEMRKHSESPPDWIV